MSPSKRKGLKVCESQKDRERVKESYTKAQRERERKRRERKKIALKGLEKILKETQEGRREEAAGEEKRR